LRSYIKIYGPPILKAIRALEKIAVDVPEVCVMSTMISTQIPKYLARDLGGESIDRKYGDFAQSYYGSSGVSIPSERCSKIISRSGESLGEYDFFFEWFKEPKQSELNELIGKIDEALAPLGCHYAMTTKR